MSGRDWFWQKMRKRCTHGQAANTEVDQRWRGSVAPARAFSSLRLRTSSASLSETERPGTRQILLVSLSAGWAGGKRSWYHRSKGGDALLCSRRRGDSRSCCGSQESSRRQGRVCSLMIDAASRVGEGRRHGTCEPTAAGRWWLQHIDCWTRLLALRLKQTGRCQLQRSSSGGGLGSWRHLSGSPARGGDWRW
jgi:hypothetical protein